MDTTQMLLGFSHCDGTPGSEQNAIEYAKTLLEPYGDCWVSPLGSLLCNVRKAEEGEPNLLLDAHLDEIGLVVTFITEDGFLRVAECGGVDLRSLLASPVWVHTRGGKIPGVICSVPPHLSAGTDKKNPDPKDSYIDIGLNGETAKATVHMGDRITFQSYPAELMNSRISGKAFDDRAGCVTILKALEYLGDNIHCGLTVQFSSMEEIGGFGAKTAAFQVNPTHALAVDASFAMTPNSKREECGEMGSGPMVGYAPILSHAMSRRLEELAEQNSIPHQAEIMNSRTGTNADQIALTRSGVKTALLSFPQRYMHTPNEVVAVKDIEDTGRLIAAWVQDIQKGGSY